MRLCVPLLLLVLAPGCALFDVAGKAANVAVIQVARGTTSPKPPPPPPPRDPHMPPRD